jgi:hypothetical protein
MEVAEMYRVIIVAILATFTMSLSVYGQNFKVLAVEEDSQEVVLRDKDTGEQWLARVGDEIEGWTIVEVTKNKVVMRKEGEGHISQKAITIPIRQHHRIVPVPAE